MPLRVLHYTSDFARASGVGTFVRRMNEALNAIGVLSCVVDPDEAFPPADFQPTLLHIHGLWLAGQHRAAGWARRNGIPVVWSTHGMTSPWAMRHRWWKKLPAWFAYQRRDLKDASLLHCTTEVEADWNRRLGLAKTVVVPMGADLPDRIGLLSSGEGAADTAGGVLLFVGRVHPVKALDRLIAAFAGVREDLRRNWKLRLVGPEEEGELTRLRTVLPDLEVLVPSGAVEFAGPKYGAELAAEYDSCACLALVSHTENFGATVVDALAHGRPVVTSTRTPWRDVVSAGCGWWVENDVATLTRTLEEVFALSPDERRQMGANGRRMVEGRYAWRAVAEKMREAYVLCQ